MGPYILINKNETTVIKEFSAKKFTYHTDVHVFQAFVNVHVDCISRLKTD